MFYLGMQGGCVGSRVNVCANSWLSVLSSAGLPDVAPAHRVCCCMKGPHTALFSRLVFQQYRQFCVVPCFFDGVYYIVRREFCCCHACMIVWRVLCVHCCFCMLLQRGVHSPILGKCHPSCALLCMSSGWYVSLRCTFCILGAEPTQKLLLLTGVLAT